MVAGGIGCGVVAQHGGLESGADSGAAEDNDGFSTAGSEALG